jgi:sugar-phosphatase
MTGPAATEPGRTELVVGAVLFDMDGTLVDSRPAVERVWRGFADRFDLDPDRVVEEAHGVRMIDTIRKLAPAGSDVLELDREFAELELGDTDGVVAIAGAAAFLSALDGLPVALVTSASRALAESRMRAAGLVLPAIVVTAQDVTRGKPNPDPYLEGARRLGIAPGTAVVFEDVPAGVASGLAAGATVVAIGDGAPAAHHRIPHYLGVTATLDGPRARITL